MSPTARGSWRDASGLELSSGAATADVSASSAAACQSDGSPNLAVAIVDFAAGIESERRASEAGEGGGDDEEGAPLLERGQHGEAASERSAVLSSAASPAAEGIASAAPMYALSFGVHLLWGLHPVLGRYLQVVVQPPMDGLVLTCAGQALSGAVLWLSEATSARLRTLFDALRRDTASLRDGTRPPSRNTHEKPREGAGWWRNPRARKLAIAFAAATTLRVALNILSLKYTAAYNTQLIQSLSPVVTAFAERLFLKTPLPRSLWPALLVMLLGMALVAAGQSPVSPAASQSHSPRAPPSSSPPPSPFSAPPSTDSSSLLPYPPLLYSPPSLHPASSLDSPSDSSGLSWSDALGASLQFGSVIFSTASRLVMVMTKGLIDKTDLVQIQNVSNGLLLLMLTVAVSPRAWLVFLYMPASTWAAFSAMTLMVWWLGKVYQVVAVRAIGPGLHASIQPVRVLVAVAGSALLLGEPVTSVSEWAGIIITSVALSTWLLYLVRADRKAGKVSSSAGLA